MASSTLPSAAAIPRRLSLCACTPPRTGRSLCKGGALSLDGPTSKFFLRPGCFWATLTQLATCTSIIMLTREVNTALRTESFLTRHTPAPPHHSPLPLPATNHPSRTCHPPWTQPHPLKLWSFLKVRPHSLGSGQFFPHESSQEWLWRVSGCHAIVPLVQKGRKQWGTQG